LMYIVHHSGSNDPSWVANESRHPLRLLVGAAYTLRVVHCDIALFYAATQRSVCER
jgi:hypothetical protein